VRLIDSRLVRCRVSPGRPAVYEGVILESVVVDSLVSDESMTVSTNAVLDRVTFRGKPDCGGLWVRPDEILDPDLDLELREWVALRTTNVVWMLDISGYEAEHVEVLGLPPRDVIWNPKKHVLVERAWRERAEWKDAPLELKSFWRMCLFRLQTFSVDSGVFGLPLERSGQYQQALRDIEWLVGNGFVETRR
jgi:hypothetical protein